MLTPLKGFVGASYISRNPQFDFTRTVNWYPSLDENQTGTNQMISQLLATPGLTNILSTPLNLPGQKSIRGIYTATNGRCFFVSGRTLYVIQGSQAPYSAVACGTLLTARGRVRFADNGNQLVLVDGPNGYSTTLANPDGDFAQIVDPAFQGASFVEYYDGYFIFNKPGTVVFYWSDPNAITFDALNFASKSGNADQIAGLVVLFRQLWLIGSQTTEIWYDVGGDNTFQRLSGPYVEQGCAAPDSIAKGETGIFWVAQSLRGGVTVVRTNGNSLIKVSTLSVDFQLQQYGAAISRATGFCYQQDGDLFYQVNPYNGTSSWVFDDTITSLLGYPPQWHERTHTIQPEESNSAVTNGTEERHLGDVAAFFNGQNLVGSFQEPKLYAFDILNGTDDGGYIARTKIAPHISVNGNRIFYSLFRLGCQTGVGTNYVVNSTSGACDCPPTAVVVTGSDGIYAETNGIPTDGSLVSGELWQVLGPTYSVGDFGSGGAFEVNVFGAPQQTVFTTIEIQELGVTFRSEDATFNNNGGDGPTSWIWSEPSSMQANTQYTFDVTVPGVPCSCANTTVSIVVNVDMPPGSCTSVGFSNTNVTGPMLGGHYGTVTPANVIINNTSYAVRQAGEDFFGDTVTSIGFSLYSADGVTPPDQNVISGLLFIDPNGAPFTLPVSEAIFSTETGDGVYSNWLWPGAFGTLFELGSNVEFVIPSQIEPSPSVSTNTAYDPCVQLSWSNVGAYEWSEEIPMSVGATGEYGQVVEWWRLGEGRNRLFRIRYTEKFPLNLSWASVDVQPTDN